MNNQKHDQFVKEMMVSFTGKDPYENNAPDVGTEGPPEPEYNAVDVFADATNDMLKDFTPMASTSDVVGEPTHVMVTDTMNDGDIENNDVFDPPTPEREPSFDPASVGDQIVFDMVDGNLCIKFADTELHLGPDAVNKLKDYLSDQETESDETGSTEDEDDSDDLNDEDENESDDLDDEDEDFSDDDSSKEEEE